MEMHGCVGGVGDVGRGARGGDQGDEQEETLDDPTKHGDRPLSGAHDGTRSRSRRVEARGGVSNSRSGSPPPPIRPYCLAKRR